MNRICTRLGGIFAASVLTITLNGCLLNDLDTTDIPLYTAETTTTDMPMPVFDDETTVSSRSFMDTFPFEADTAIYEETTTETQTTAETILPQTEQTPSETTDTAPQAVAEATEEQTTATVKTTETTTASTDVQTPDTFDPKPYAKKLDALVAKKAKSQTALLIAASDGTVLYSYQPKQMISGASLIKVSYVYFCCTQLSNGVKSLSTTMTYTKEMYLPGAGVISKNGYGKTYTVAQLIDYTLRYSDNIAYLMLVKLFGTDGYNKMVKTWGYSVKISAGSEFPALSADFMNTALNKMYLSRSKGECWKTAWNAMENSSRSIIRKCLPSGLKAAVKYGSIPTQYHEVCLLETKTPCNLIIFSPANDYNEDTAFIKNVANTAIEMINDWVKSET